MKPAPNEIAPLTLSASDFDNDVVDSLRQMVFTISGETVPARIVADDEKAIRFAAARQRLQPRFKITNSEMAIIAALAFFPLPAIWLLIVLVFDFIRDGPYWNLLPPLFTTLIFSVALYWQLGGGRIRSKVKKIFLPETLVISLPLLHYRSQMEKAYCEAASALLQEPPSAWGGPQAVKGLLHDLRALFQVGKQAATRRAQVEQAMSHQSLAETDAEAARLTERIQAARDEDARELLRQSLAHLDARRARLSAMEPVRERLEAQEEAVFQALREAHTIFSALPFSEMTAPANGSSAPLTSDWGETAQRLRHQPQTIEAAVQEVLSVTQTVTQTSGR